MIQPLVFLAALLLSPPHVQPSQSGARIDAVTVQTYGVIKADALRQYLSLKKGDVLEQAAVDRDYSNLWALAGFIPRLTIVAGAAPNTVALHWIVMAKWLKPTSHPFYGDQPLLPAIQGVGFILTSPQINRRGANVSIVSQLSRRANLVRALYTAPVHINPVKGVESDVLLDVFGGRGVYRASQPLAINIYSWNTGAEAFYLVHGTNGTQVEFGARVQRTTTALSTGIVSPALYQTSQHPARNTLLQAGLSHACPVPATQWFPPYCLWQYRFVVQEAIGGLGATNEYQTYSGDAAHYISAGRSTFVLHASAVRTGGVLPDSFLVCTAGMRGYPKPFCGTDAQSFQAEYRLADRIPAPLHVVFFTETAASRIRGGTQAFAPLTFQWHADSGIGVIYRGFRLDLAYGTQGSRLTFELQGQTY